MANISTSRTIQLPAPQSVTAETPAANSNPERWEIGEHLAVAGDTGTGKTYLISKIVQLRQYVVFFRTKSDEIKLDGFRKVRSADAMDGNYATRLLLDPIHSHQLREGYEMLERAWDQGGWTIVVDEEWYVEKMLKLGPLVERLLTQGRSKKISVVVGMQRPSQISRFILSQATHLFTFRMEGRDMQIMKESTTPRILEPLNALKKYEFVYYHRGERKLMTGNAKTLERVFIGKTKIGGAVKK